VAQNLHSEERVLNNIG